MLISGEEGWVLGDKEWGAGALGGVGCSALLVESVLSESGFSLLLSFSW